MDVLGSPSTPHVRSYTLGTPLISTASVSLRYPLVLTPRHKNNYFKPRESFNLLGMLQNPMMMIMVLTGLMMLGMPYIMVSLLSPVDVPCSRIGAEKLGPANTGGAQKPARKDCKHSKFPTERGCQVWVCHHRACRGISHIKLLDCRPYWLLKKSLKHP